MNAAEAHLRGGYLCDFRTGQLEAILPALHGRDVFMRMATGSGKSLCMFTVPLAYSNDAVGVIISPLNALMDEQCVFYHKSTQSKIAFVDSLDPQTLWHVKIQKKRLLTLLQESTALVSSILHAPLLVFTLQCKQKSYKL